VSRPTTERPCAWCGRRTRARGGICQPCKHASIHFDGDDPIALPPGEWVLDPRRRVVVYREAVS
jgi:hypothetical protein